MFSTTHFRASLLVGVTFAITSVALAQTERMIGRLEPSPLGQPHETHPWTFGQTWLTLVTPKGLRYFIDTDKDPALYDKLFANSGYEVEIEGRILPGRPELFHAAPGTVGTFVASSLNWINTQAPRNNLGAFLRRWESEDGKLRIEVRRQQDADPRALTMSWSDGKSTHDFDFFVGNLNVASPPQVDQLPSDLRYGAFRFGKEGDRPFAELRLAQFPIATEQVFAPSLATREFPVRAAEHIALRVFHDTPWDAELYHLRVEPSEDRNKTELLSQAPAAICHRLIQHADYEGVAIFNKLHTVND